MDFIKGELIDVIEWTDDSRDTLSFRFPDEDKAIKNGAQLIVRESQQVQFVYLGRVRRYVRPRQAHADDRQHPDPDAAEVVEVRVQLPVQGGRLLRHDAAVHGQQVGHRQSDHDARRRSRHRAGARVRHVRFQDRRSEAVPEGSRRLGPELPARRIRRHDAFADRQHLCRCAGVGEDSGVRRREPLQRARRGAAAAHQSGRRPRNMACRSPASSSRTSRCRRKSSRRSTSVRAWRRSGT